MAKKKNNYIFIRSNNMTLTELIYEGLDDLIEIYVLASLKRIEIINGVQKSRQL